MLLTGDLVYLQIAGIFGWSGTPAAFQVVTRAITWELKHALQSRTVMYVDVIVGVCFKTDLKGDLQRTREVCTDLLGPSSVADDKTEHGTRLDVIGYTIDLSTSDVNARVLISRKNFLTALHGFISTDTSKRINLQHAQRLASRLTRHLPGDATVQRRASRNMGSDRAACLVPTVGGGCDSDRVLARNVVPGPLSGD
jgi:hypothetical protein